MINTFKNTSLPSSSEVARGFSYNNSLIEGDGNFNPASEDDIIEIKDLLAEPESVKISMDALLYYNNEYLKKCLGIGDLIGSVPVNRELMGVIEDLQRKSKEENEEDSSEELYKPEILTVAAEEGSENSDVIEGNQETEGEPKKRNKRLKTEASDLSRNIDGYEFKSDESTVEEMKLDVAYGNNVVENHAAEETIAAKTKLKKVASKRCTKDKS